MTNTFMKKLMMKTKMMKKIINAIIEDFFDDIESKDIINDEIEQDDNFYYINK